MPWWCVDESIVDPMHGLFLNFCMGRVGTGTAMSSNKQRRRRRARAARVAKGEKNKAAQAPSRPGAAGMSPLEIFLQGFTRGVQVGASVSTWCDLETFCKSDFV